MTDQQETPERTQTQTNAEYGLGLCQNANVPVREMNNVNVFMGWLVAMAKGDLVVIPKAELDALKAPPAPPADPGGTEAPATH